MFSTLVELVVYAGLKTRLAETKDMYVLCPTNDAFQRAGITASPAMMGGVPLSREEVQEVLKQHVIPRARDTHGNLRGFGSARTLSGTRITFEHGDDMRTSVSTANSTACVLMQGFTSTNAAFAGIGRVLL